jgi:predicted DNA-binding WGR domain protein
MDLLKRIDYEKNMRRWYLVTVQPTLLDECSVVCGWGRKGTVQQQWRALPAETPEEAEGMARRIVEKKRRRGYEVVG